MLGASKLTLPSKPGNTERSVAWSCGELRAKAFRYGVTCLGDAELLALVLSTGTNTTGTCDLASQLLNESGGLAGVARLTTVSLARYSGIGKVKAARVAAALELGRRALCEAVDQPRLVLATAEDVADWARPRLGALEHEEVWLLCLDGRNALKSASKVAQGGLHGCAVTPKDILRPALSACASAIIVLHNHPSGSAEPSSEDIEMTQHLALASRTLGIPLLDHVIVARKRTCSLAELGVIP